MVCPQLPSVVLTTLPCNPAITGNCYDYLANASQAQIDVTGENLLYQGKTSDLVSFCRDYNLKCNDFLDRSCSSCGVPNVSLPNDLGALCGCFVRTDPCNTVCNRGKFTVKRANQPQCNFGGSCIIDNITIGTAGGNVEQACDCSTCDCIIDRSLINHVGYVQKCASNRCFVREIDGSMTLVPCGSSGEGWSNKTKSMFIAGVVVVGLGLCLAFLSFLE